MVGRRALSTTSSGAPAGRPLAMRAGVMAGAAGLGFIAGTGFQQASADGPISLPAPSMPEPSDALEKAPSAVLEGLGTALGAVGVAPELEAAVWVELASRTNAAFVFVKPHAVTPKVVDLVRSGLSAAGLAIKGEGAISNTQIDQESLIDVHYGAIASKAVVLAPSELNVPDKGKIGFKKMFGADWESSVKAGKVYNAKQACEKLGIDADGLDAKWSKLTRGKDLIKFGGGFYCGKVDGLYVMNGFYMSMRSKYTAAASKGIHYFVVEWDPKKLSWADFRGKVLGGTKPDDAEPGSLRRVVFDTWKDLGLPAEPDVGDNGVHASASPFEAMAERHNWLKSELASDPFARAIKSLGVPDAVRDEWMKDAQVATAAGKGSVFDLVEDEDSKVTLEKLATVTLE